MTTEQERNEDLKVSRFASSDALDKVQLLQVQLQHAHEVAQEADDRRELAEQALVHASLLFLSPSFFALLTRSVLSLGV